MSAAVSSSFSRAASRYDRHAEVQKAMAAWLGEWLPATRSGRALELGAGPGTFTRRLLPWGGELLATDGSSEMAEVGRKLLPEASWRTMAAEAPAAGPWDWILSSSLLQWMHDPTAVFSAWRREMSPKGKVLGGLFAAGSLPELESLHRNTPLVWRTPEEWAGHLRAAGFTVVRSECELRTFRHDSARAFLRDLHGIGAAPRRRLSPTEMRRLLADYERQFVLPAGGFRSTWAFLRFEAVVR